MIEISRIFNELLCNFLSLAVTSKSIWVTSGNDCLASFRLLAIWSRNGSHLGEVCSSARGYARVNRCSVFGRSISYGAELNSTTSALFVFSWMLTWLCWRQSAILRNRDYWEYSFDVCRSVKTIVNRPIFNWNGINYSIEIEQSVPSSVETIYSLEANI